VSIPIDEAIVILGGRVRFGADGRLEGALARRCARGAELHRARRGAIVVACGGCVWGDIVEADAIADEIVARGVPREHVVRERMSVSTRDNARFAAIALAKRGIDRAAIVTCDWHLPRAIRAFEKEGLVVSGHPVASAKMGFMRSAYRTIRERVAARIDVWR
jgi:uncharacterized SAM-binding protein YcdF (DUF218 family)